MEIVIWIRDHVQSSLLYGCLLALLPRSDLLAHGAGASTLSGDVDAIIVLLGVLLIDIELVLLVVEMICGQRESRQIFIT